MKTLGASVILYGLLLLNSPFARAQIAPDLCSAGIAVGESVGNDRHSEATKSVKGMADLHAHVFGEAALYVQQIIAHMRQGGLGRAVGIAPSGRLHCLGDGHSKV